MAAHALELLERDEDGRWLHVRTERHPDLEHAIAGGERWISEDPDHRQDREYKTSEL